MCLSSLIIGIFIGSIATFLFILFYYLRSVGKDMEEIKLEFEEKDLEKE
jgi:hypothetical protein